MATLVDCNGIAKRYVRGTMSVDVLSGGQQQRVAIARAITHEPKAADYARATLHMDKGRLSGTVSRSAA